MVSEVNSLKHFCTRAYIIPRPGLLFRMVDVNSERQNYIDPLFIVAPIIHLLGVYGVTAWERT